MIVNNTKNIFLNLIFFFKSLKVGKYLTWDSVHVGRGESGEISNVTCVSARISVIFVSRCLIKLLIHHTTLNTLTTESIVAMDANASICLYIFDVVYLSHSFRHCPPLNSNEIIIIRHRHREIISLDIP